ncbi:MAG: hypothetical protein GEU90_21475 [Gemmatimonas sp.]|nr:hypothetical protein [Gemmatimonas sp.]
MRLPNAERGVVSDQKVVAYLLSEAHPDGRGKARFFSGYGFTAREWHELAEALRRHAAENPLVETVETAFGVRYVVEGILHAPDGRTPEVRAVWFIDWAADAPRLVTAYPVKRR